MDFPGEDLFSTMAAADASNETPNARATTDETLSVEETMAYIREPILKGIYIVIGAVGMLGNLFVAVIAVLSFGRMTQKMTNMLIVNQCIIDMLASFIIFTMGVTNTTGNGMRKDSPYDQFVCRIWLSRFPLWAAMVASTYSTIAITIERYVAIVHPIMHKVRVTKLWIYVGVAFSWFVGIGFNFPWMVVTSDIIGSDCYPIGVWPTYAAQTLNGVMIFLIHYLIPLLLMAFFYSRMFRALQAKVSSEVNPNSQYDRAKRNVFKTLMLVCCCFVLCWSCNQIFYFAYTLGRPTDFGSPFYHFTVVAVFSNSCFNPFIYAAKYKEFQQGGRAVANNHPLDPSN